MDLPTGTLTFLFTDIEGSTRLWEAHPEAMRAAIARHDFLLRQAVVGNNGYVIKTTGDGLTAVFTLAPDALAAALSAQLALLAEPWHEDTVLRSRMGLHTGAGELREGDYYGTALNRCARLMSAGHGGQTLLSDVTHELTRDTLAPDVSLSRLGEYRLKDLARPETVYQLGFPALLADFPPLRTLDAIPNNLPQQVSSFVGREKAIAEVTERLARARLVTLTGSGGAGKTRLSLQAAAEVMEKYVDGVWFVELAALTDPALVPQTIASVLGVKEQLGQDLTQTVTQALKDKNLLLLLDNCEHLIQASAQVVAALIRACPRVTVLATTREALGIVGEQIYRVPSLSLPDPRTNSSPTAASLSQYESVRLFIERAQAVISEFAVTNQSAPALAQLCFRLDGIPLAIELAAARARSLTVEEINARLDSRFRLLTGGDRSALPRQQTLRALIDWSFDLLTESEKTLFGRLSVFAGGWTLAQAEAVCGSEPIEDWEVLDLLTSLADKSLILPEEAAEQATRYRMLETIREYAAERRAVSGEEGSIQERHISYFLGLAGEAASQLTGPEQVRWLNRLEIEHDNLRAALDACALHSAQSPRDAALNALTGLRLSDKLVQFWEARGYLTEGRSYLERALGDRSVAERATEWELASAKDVKNAVAGALLSAGRAAWGQGDHATARSRQAESIAIYREIQDMRGIASAVNNLGLSISNQGGYPEARALFEESLALFRELDDRNGLANTLNNLGIVAVSQGDYLGAILLYEESIAYYREMGDKKGIAGLLTNLGNVAYYQGEPSRARPLYAESLTLRREVGDKDGVANTLNSLGAIAGVDGDLQLSRALFEESVAISREIGDKSRIAYALTNLGAHFAGQGDNVNALSAYEEGLILGREMGDMYLIAHLLQGVAAVRASGQATPLRGAILWAASSALFQRIGALLSPPERTEVDAAIAKARVELGDEAAWAAAWAEGEALSWEQAADFARQG